MLRPVPDYVIVMRHGHFPSNDPGAIYDDSLGLDAKGKGQIANAAKGLRIRGYLGKVTDHVVSPAHRAQDTAHIVEPDAKWRTDRRLPERDYKDGFVSPDQRTPEQLAHPLTYEFPGGVETMKHAGERVKTVVDGLQTSTLVVCHEEDMMGFRYEMGVYDEETLAESIDAVKNGDKMLEVRNGEADIYTSINPRTGQKSNRLQWMRSLNDSDPALRTDTGWMELNAREIGVDQAVTQSTSIGI